MFSADGLHSGLESAITLLRRGILRQLSWRIEDHYQVDASFRLDAGFAQRFGSISVGVLGGNVILPHLLRVHVNGFPLEYRSSPGRAPRGKWKNDRAYDDLIWFRLPPGMLQVGENAVSVEARMLPGLARRMGPTESDGLHNASVGAILLEVSPRGGGGA